jgi:hypothetical protein
MEETKEPTQEEIKKFELNWSGDRHEIEYWLKRTAWRNLKDTVYGIKKGLEEVPHLIHDDPMLRMAYIIDLSTFVHAEKLALEAVAASIPFAENEECQMFLATQVMDEARHYEVFKHRLKDLGLTNEEITKVLANFNTKSFKKFESMVWEQIDKKDLLGSTIALNIMLEGLAHPVYRYEMKYWARLDPGMSNLIKGALQDEVQHANFGEVYAKRMIECSSEARNKARRLFGEFKIVVDELFDESRKNYVRLYQEVANNHMDLMRDLEIFPGIFMGHTTEEEQSRQLKMETQKEFDDRIKAVGISL